MKLLNLFRKAPQIREAGELSRFIDENAAFVIQKGIYEYARARAGHYAKVLFKEPIFLDAVERSRWRGFPMGLVMVSEVAAGVLEEETGAARQRVCGFIHPLALSVFDGYRVPDSLGAAEWSGEREELDRRLGCLGGQARRRSFEVPDEYAKPYFDLMPIHEKLKARDYSTTVSYLKLTLCNIHVELTKRLDAAAVGRLLGEEHRGTGSR
ncbi:MAG: hypothetical protein F9K44_04680 [Hyphomicrobiaceae bacterium]|nr:MAG: hypothetical protein F9K44_04680 [Hyphomicrobiaceae bacterium]